MKENEKNFSCLKIRIRQDLAEKLKLQSRKNSVSINLIVNQAIENNMVENENYTKISLEMPNEMLDMLKKEAKEFGLELNNYLLFKIIQK